MIDWIAQHWVPLGLFALVWMCWAAIVRVEERLIETRQQQEHMTQLLQSLLDHFEPPLEDDDD